VANLTGKMLEVTLLHYPQGLAAQRLLILGAGKKDKSRDGRASQARRHGG